MYYIGYNIYHGNYSVNRASQHAMGIVLLRFRSNANYGKIIRKYTRIPRAANRLIYITVIVYASFNSPSTTQSEWSEW